MTTAEQTEDGELREVQELATRGTEVGNRLSGLQTAVRAARGRLDDTLLDEIQAGVDRSAGRLRLSATHTVVGIAGATGSGKSSTYNALVGLELSSIGVRRPTTSWATACVWGADGAEEVLDWLGIPPRHQTMRDSMLDASPEERALDGVVLMDLPDHDSTEVAHHLEVDRLVELADLLVWVLDPQKYADAALHNRYLAPYRSHADIMLVVLNQIDSIPEAERPAVVDDVRRLLAADGLESVKVLAISAKTGLGMDELRHEIEARVAAKRSTTARVEADIAAAAERLDDPGTARTLQDEQVAEFEAAVAHAAGAEALAATVGRRAKTRAARAVAWLPVAHGSRLLSNPEGGLSIDIGEDVAKIGGRGVEPAPKVAPVSRELIDTAVRDLSVSATEGIGGQWGEAIQRRGSTTVAGTTVKLGAALSQADLRVNRLPGWVRTVQILQWVLFIAALAGGCWWLATWVVDTDAPQIAGVGLALILLIGGLALGVLLWGVARGAVGHVGRQRQREVEDELRGIVSDVVGPGVVDPIREELGLYSTFKNGLSQARA